MSKPNTVTGTDASTTIPGSIFIDDIATPPQSISLDADFNPSPSPSPSTSSNNGNGGATQIEVSSTIQIVLIALGIAVGVLFVMGVVATYYISHKNKRACLKKQEQDAAAAAAAAAAEAGDGDLESGGGGGGGGGGGDGGVREKEGGREQDSEMTMASLAIGRRGDLHNKEGSFSSHTVLLDNEKGHKHGYNAASEDGSMTGSGVGFGWSNGGTPRPESSYTYTDSPSSNTTPLTTSTLVAPMVVQRSQNPRNSFIDVAQVYAHRQSLAHPADPAIAMQQRMSMIMVDNSQYGLSSHGGSGTVGSTGATVGSSGHSGQWGGTATTIPSDENDESHLVDPFKTNNNSMASLNQILEQGPPPTQPLVSTQPPPAALMMMPAVSLRRPPQPLPDMDISYQPPTKSLDPAVRPSRRTSALYQQSTLADRRSVAGWPTNMTGAEDGKSGANSWHRKRASVVIPEGTIPVRLWKEDAAAMATAAGTTNDDVSLRTQLASGTIPRIGIVSEKKEGESTGTGAGEGVMGYRPSVRNGAAVFEGSMPRKMTASRSTSRSRLDDDTSDAQQNAIDSLGISDAPATATLQQPQQTSTYRRKWATGQIAVDDYNIQTAGLQSGGSGEDTEHVIVSLPSPRGCLLEDEYNYNHQPMGDGQDEYEYGMRSLPIVLTHRTTASSSGGSSKGSSSGKGNGGSGGGGGGGRRSLEMANAAASGTTSAGAKFSYLDDYREQQQQQKLQQQQQQQQ